MVKDHTVYSAAEADPSISFKQKTFLDILSSFGISNCSVKVRSGKFFDDYDILLPRGFRFSKIEKILDDIGVQTRSISRPQGSLSMRKGSYTVRVQKKSVASPDMMSLFVEAHSRADLLVPIGLGCDSYGESIIFDLNKMPNLIVAGATGSGKSVLLHNIIISAMTSSSQVILVDPKYVEFSMYRSHLGDSNVINSSEELKNLINLYLVPKMNETFLTLQYFNCRNVTEFNKKYPQIRISPTVLVIDEWADLFYSDKSLVDDISKLAAKCRAAGISIVLATQRPSSDVISGIIKANFPGRIALRVASQIDSRIILDKAGAENLTEKGDGIIFDESGAYKQFKTGYIEDIGRFLNENFIRRD